jgi:hypothetical protein
MVVSYEELIKRSTPLLRLERGLLGPALAWLHNEKRLVLEEVEDKKRRYTSLGLPRSGSLAGL